MSVPGFTEADWRKSSRSAQNDQCVEVAAVRSIVGVRDSKAPAGPVVALRCSAFRRLVTDIRGGVHDL